VAVLGEMMPLLLLLVVLVVIVLIQDLSLLLELLTQSQLAAVERVHLLTTTKALMAAILFLVLPLQRVVVVVEREAVPM
jgi:hypothetical protein